MSDVERVAEWFAGVIDSHESWIPDASAKKAILAEWRRINEEAAKPRARTTVGVMALQWDRMVVMLALGVKDMAPGWDPSWDEVGGF